MTKAILFVKENRDLWGHDEVREALRRVKENEKSERIKKKMATHEKEVAQIGVESVARGLESIQIDYSSSD